MTAKSHFYKKSAELQPAMCQIDCTLKNYFKAGIMSSFV